MSFSLVVLIILGVITALGAHRGYKRGVERQAMRLASVVIAMLLSFLATSIIDQLIFDELASMSAEEFISTLEGAGLQISGTEFEPLLLNIEPVTLAYIISIPSALIIMPLIYVVAFEIIKLLLLIPYYILAKLFRLKSKKRTFLSKMLGMGLGALQGIIVTIVLTMPVVGILSSAAEAAETIKENADTDENAAAIATMYEENLEEYTSDPVVNILGALGGRGIYESFSTVTIEGTEYDVLDEITEPVISIISSADCFEQFDWKNPTADNKQGISIVLESIDNSTLMKKVFVNTLDVLVKTYRSGEFEIEAEAHLKEVVDTTIDVLDSINGDSFNEDVSTLLDAYFILGREGVLPAFEAGEFEGVRDALVSTHVPHELDPTTPCDSTGGNVTVLKKTVEVLDSDEHTRPLIRSLSKISVATLAANFGSDKSADEVYETVKTGITDTLSISKDGKEEAEYKAEVRESLDTALKSSDIEFGVDEQYILDNMTDYVWDNYDTLVKTDENGNQVVSEDEVNRVILSYYDAYLGEGGEFDEIP